MIATGVSVMDDRLEYERAQRQRGAANNGLRGRGTP